MRATRTPSGRALGGATVTDNCDDHVTTHVTNVVFHEDDCYGFYTLHWSAGDECDNHASATQVIDIFDTTPPTVTISLPIGHDCVLRCGLLLQHDDCGVGLSHCNWRRQLRLRGERARVL